MLWGIEARTRHEQLSQRHATEAMLDCGKIEIDKFDVRLNAAYNTLMQR
ncbi:hypothetical protein [Mesorhizobium sp. B2-3-12]|nr:hypothetical protein [Mesorhizobium sp. B2-3-12]